MHVGDNLIIEYMMQLIDTILEGNYQRQKGVQDCLCICDNDAVIKE
jgi:hypothetical protein